MARGPRVGMNRALRAIARSGRALGWTILKPSAARSEHIPAAAVRRLSLYLRQLEAFHSDEHPTVSSRELGKALGLSDAQVRKDLAHFGQFGHPGIGYAVPELIQRVKRILGTDRRTSVLLVGYGNLGRALMSYRGFASRGFDIVAIFDSDPNKVGTKTPETPPLVVQPIGNIASVARSRQTLIGVLAVPAGSAQAVADELVKAGIRAILNFAPVALRLPRGVAVASVDLAVHLEQLAFELTGVVAS